MTLILLLLVIGAALIFIEVLLPGGVAGIAGFGCLAGAVWIGYRDLGPQGGSVVLAGVLAASMAGVWSWFRFFPDSRVARPFISRSAVGELGGDQPQLLHHSGIALTQLRPSGVALIDGQRLDVVTEGALIERDTPIRVVLVEGSRIVVRTTG
jgi:membrane-bound serine protease (ClpP class)